MANITVLEALQLSLNATKKYVDENNQLYWMEPYEITGTKTKLANVDISTLTKNRLYAFNYKKYSEINKVGIKKIYNDGTKKSITTLSQGLEYIYFSDLSSIGFTMYIKYSHGTSSKITGTFGSTASEYTSTFTPIVLDTQSNKEFIPTKEYDPATKKYVDDKLAEANASGGYTHPDSHPASMITGLATVATSGSYNDLNDKPTIPTKTSDLTNDSDFTTKTYVDEHDDHLLYLLNGGLPLKLNVTQEELESIINLTDNTYTILSSISPDLIKSVVNGDDWYSTLILNNDFAFSIKSTGSIISSITCIEGSNSINMQYTNSVYRNDLPFIDVSDYALCVTTLPDGVESVAFAKGVPKRYNMATKKYVDEQISNVELTPGPKGDKGDIGPQGPKGDDGLTTQVRVNGTTYTQVDGLITLPDYPEDVGASSHTHANKDILDTITADKVTNWDNKLDSIPAEYITETELNAKGYLTEHQDISGKANVSGQVFTGTVEAPIVKATSYFFTPALINEGNLTSYYHRLNLGYANHDYWEFHEYGGDYRFYENKNGTAAGGTMIANIKSTYSDFKGEVRENGTRVYSPNNKPTADDLGITIPSIDGLATETYVNNKVAGLIDSAPEALNTLNELATALGNDANFATTISNQIGLKANSADLATVATSGNYNDLTNKPTIPTVTNDLTNELKANYDAAYTHSTSAHAPVNAQKNSDITKAEIEAKLTGNITSHTHSQYLTSIPSEYITEQELTSKGYITEAVLTSKGYATESQINSAVEAAATTDEEVKTTVNQILGGDYIE